jgi:integrase
VEIVQLRLDIVAGHALFPVARRGSVTNSDPDVAMSWSSRFVSDLKAKADELHGERVPRWTVHGIRHTVATHLRADLGVSAEAVSLILGHTPPGQRVTRTYNRADLLAERAAALTSWAEWINRVAAGTHEPRGTVVALRR